MVVRQGRDVGIVLSQGDIRLMNFEKPDKVIRGFGDFSQINVTSGDWNSDGKMDLAVVDTAADRTFVYNSIADAVHCLHSLPLRLSWLEAIRW